MPKILQRRAQKFTVDEFLSDDVDLPRKMELIDGVFGPFSDKAKLALLTNWGADKIVKLTGPEIWREVLVSGDSKR